MPSATLRILARNFESDGFARGDDLSFKFRFSDLSVESLSQGCSSHRFERARQFFPRAMYDDCVIERVYESIPPMSRDFTRLGLGGIVLAPEELLFLLRLYRPGDLGFVAVSVETFNPSRGRTEHLTLHPYRLISEVVSESTRQFVFNRVDFKPWESFAESLKASPSWKAEWFQVARHYFLYGSTDDFNPNFKSEIDRVANYIISLEAVLVPERDFSSQRLRERAVKLLGLKRDEAVQQKKLLNKLYAIRSTLLHGELPSDKQLSFLRDRGSWMKVEQLVRDLLIASARKIPADETERRSFLSALYNPTDKLWADRISEQFRAIKDQTVRRGLIETLLK